MRFDAGHVSDAGRMSKSSPLDALDPRCRVLSALLFSAVLASTQSMAGLLAGCVIPFILLFTGDMRGVIKPLVHINSVVVFFWVILPLTAQGPTGAMTYGLRLALLITCKLNLLSIVMIRMIASLGLGELDTALAYFHIPEKLRVLLLLTMRYTFLLKERVAAMTRAVRLRAPELRGGKLYRTFACMLGTTLIHSSDRSERSMLAMRCRGGIAGFSQCPVMNWRLRDTLLCVFFAINAALIVVVSL